MEKLYSIVGNRIMRYRKEAKLTQFELAEYCQISRASLSNIESGKQRITIDLLYKIAEKLKITVFNLLPANLESEMDFLSSTRVIDSDELLNQIEKAKQGNENE